MFKVNRDSVAGYKEMEIPYTVLSTVEDAKNLAIFLPGAGYTVQAPLLHFSTGVFLNKSFDVLQVNYSYIDKFYDDFTIEDIDQSIKRLSTM